MERDEQRYPVSEERFNKEILPVIVANNRGKGRPPKVSHYQAFSGILYVLRTGCPWRDIPKEYGYWHVIYDRFNRGSTRGLWAKIFLDLQKKGGIGLDGILIDSAAMKIHRPGAGSKRGGRAKG